MSINIELSLFQITNIFDNATSFLVSDFVYNGAAHLFTFKWITEGATEKVNNQGKPIIAAPIGSTLFFAKAPMLQWPPKNVYSLLIAIFCCVQ
jgi:hypothetical protein